MVEKKQWWPQGRDMRWLGGDTREVYSHGHVLYFDRGMDYMSVCVKTDQIIPLWVVHFVVCKFYLKRLNLWGKYSTEELDMAPNWESIEKYLYELRVENNFLNKITILYIENIDKYLYQNLKFMWRGDVEKRPIQKWSINTVREADRWRLRLCWAYL